MPIYLTLYHKRSAAFSSRKTEERGYQSALEQLCLFKEENLKKKKPIPPIITNLPSLQKLVCLQLSSSGKDLFSKDEN